SPQTRPLPPLPANHHPSLAERTTSRPNPGHSSRKAARFANQAQTELVMSAMATPTKPKWGRVWRYEGRRGVVWRIRYTDAKGRRILETLGKEPAWDRKRAERELRRRLVDVERDGYQHPEKISFAQFAERWLNDYLPGRNLKLTTLDGYRQTLNRH